MGLELIVFHEGALVEEQIESLPSCQLVVLVLGVDSLLAASQDCFGLDVA